MKKVLIIGGTGFIGKNLILELKNHYKIKCLVRKSTKNSNIDFLKSSDAELVYCDNINFDSLNTAINNIDIVIYLIGIIRETKDSKFKKLHCENVKDIIKICKKKGVNKIVYLSVLGINAKVTEYFYTKFKAEEELKKSKLNYIIFRPSIIFGMGDVPINSFISMIKRHKFVFYFSTRKMQPIYIKDFTKCMRLSLRKKWNKVYDIGGKDALNLEEISDLIIKRFGLNRVRIKIPLSLLRLMSLFPNPFLTYAQLKMLQVIHTTSFNAQKEFNFKFLSFENYLIKLK